MVSRARKHTQLGFTLVEMLFCLGLFGVLGTKLYMVLRDARRYSSQETSAYILEEQTMAAIDRIAIAIMSSNREALILEMETPLHTSDLYYQVKFGVENGEVVWDDPESIGLPERNNELIWSKSVDTERERQIVWSRLVAPFLEGELPNGVDDNGNGLIDEKGLSFTVEGSSVTVRLTLERASQNGTVVTKTVESTVTCRNLGSSS